MADPVLARIPIVVIQSPDANEQVGPVGAAVVVRKPIDPTKLVEAIERQTGHRRSPLLVLGFDEKRLEALVASESFQIVAAKSASEGRRLLETLTPSAVILDVNNVDGSISFVEELRREGRTDRVPVLAIHGELAERDRRRLGRLDAVLVRGPETLQRMLESAIRELSGDGQLSDAGVS